MQPDKNRGQLMCASFLTLVAAGMGFAVRAGLLRTWGEAFGFTQTELGTITGGGIVGFGLMLMVASQFADRIGYKAMLSIGFVFHLCSFIGTLAATRVYEVAGKDATFQCLYWGMFMFALGNGFCETAINPLVANLYPERKTHYLNILHAGWPGGLISGGLLGKVLVGHVRWEVPVALCVVPTLAYGVIVLRRTFPASETAKAGVSYRQMLKEFASPVLLFLLLLQACVGYVELGTDSWIANITDSLLAGHGLYLFVYASSIMFVLRFFAGPIVERISPIGLLCGSSLLGALGLMLLGSFKSAGMVWLAVTIYGLGKTFLWPTMLGVVGERFPRGGAVTMGAVSAVAALSAGFLGGPGIGYQQDRAASTQLAAEAPATYGRYAAAQDSQFLGFEPVRGLDAKKVGVLLEAVPATTLNSDWQIASRARDVSSSLSELKRWWDQTGRPHLDVDRSPLERARVHGGQVALRQTALIPLLMFLGFLVLVLHFRSRGGYRAVRLEDAHAESSRLAAASGAACPRARDREF